MKYISERCFLQTSFPSDISHCKTLLHLLFPTWNKIQATGKTFFSISLKSLQNVPKKLSFGKITQSPTPFSPHPQPEIPIQILLLVLIAVSFIYICIYFFLALMLLTLLTFSLWKPRHSRQYLSSKLPFMLHKTRFIFYLKQFIKAYKISLRGLMYLISVHNI